MEFINHTPFPAQKFAGVDQHNQEFHVVALRQTLSWDNDGALVYADEQLPLCEEDQVASGEDGGFVLQESDYCQFKPRCDIIVNATAYAPQGKATRWFKVRLVVKEPDIPAPLPPRPDGINQFVGPSQALLDDWHSEIAARRDTPGKLLVDKHLAISGPRSFRKHVWPLRIVATAVKVLSFGLLRIPTWRLTLPAPVLSVPINKTYAFGGECRINADQKAAARVARRNRLPPQQVSAQRAAEENQSVAIAIDAYEPNTAGRGFATQWYVNAMRLSSIPAPQIALSRSTLRASHFARALDGRLNSKTSSALVAGFGVRAKAHPARRILAGTIDDDFARGDAWLPDDFDFSVWNAAEPDQQIDFLKGDEIVELTNMCGIDTPAARVDEQGNTRLSLSLPRHECHLLLRLEGGEMFREPMVIDTLIVDPDHQRISIIWRLVVAKLDDEPLRAVETRMYTFDERDHIRKQIGNVQMHLQNIDTSTTAMGRKTENRLWHG